MRSPAKLTDKYRSTREQASCHAALKWVFLNLWASRERRVVCAPCSTLRMRTKWLLASMPGIHTLKTFKDKEGLVARAVGSGARRCPDCGTASTSRKGGYIRRLQDLPVQGMCVRLELQMTRWRCRNDQCARQSFVERLDKSAPSHARRTCRVTEVARLLGHATGERVAEKLMYRLGIPPSRRATIRFSVS
jgi:hypothetical protein